MPQNAAVQPRGMVAVLEADPDLAAVLPPAERTRATQALRATERTRSPGAWTVPVPNSPGMVGLLIVEGIVSGITEMEERRQRELLGPGDLLRPWTEPEESSLVVHNTWSVVSPMRMLVLDRRFAVTATPWPEVTCALMDRLVVRARRLGFQRAASTLPRTTERLLLLLWHFAERWGSVTTDGVLLELPITHGGLAELIGTHRPTVTTGLGELRDRGIVTSTGDGSWMLRPPAPATFAELREQVGLPAAEPAPRGRFADGRVGSHLG